MIWLKRFNRTVCRQGGYFFFMTVITSVITEIITILNWNKSWLVMYIGHHPHFWGQESNRLPFKVYLIPKALYHIRKIFSTHQSTKRKAPLNKSAWQIKTVWYNISEMRQTDRRLTLKVYEITANFLREAIIV